MNKKLKKILKYSYLGNVNPTCGSGWYDLLLNQLKKIDRYNSLRRKNALQWDSWCENNGYGKPLIINGSVPVFLRYPVMVSPEKKKNTSWVTVEVGVQAGVWFRSHIHPVNRSVKGCPNADRAVQQCINLPGLIE